ncbi:MAG: hypothetical protein V9E99_00490 [Microthrixaceae bacterium]|nr:hypothetical protein [Microthrixaceae bacterium]HMS14201.1 hypothetical protein [Microthrixaceae bacterium]HMT25777.1 hypothetical protein [Microthrixaceae bacterium]HMT61977.1 hypothetical protein [Microthrixaceae bacterium]
MSDVMDMLGDDDGLLGLREQLTAALAPERGLEDRLEQRIRERLLDRESLSVFADLLGLGIRTTAAVLLTDDPPSHKEESE